MKMELGVRVMHLHIKDCQRLSVDHQKLGERPGADSSAQPQKEPTLVTP